MEASPDTGSVRERAARLEEACRSLGLRSTRARRMICWVLAESEDHPDSVAIHRRIQWLDNSISLATVYRSLRQMSDAGVIARRDFGCGRSRYEDVADGDHGHLIDLHGGKVIEFRDSAIEARLAKAARRLGYRMTGWRVEIFAEASVPANKNARIRPPL